MFEIVTSSTLEENAVKAVDLLIEDLSRQNMEQPEYLMVQMNAAYDADLVAARLKERLPTTKIHAATSCSGVMTQHGYASAAGGGMAVFAISDPNGRYGCGYMPLGDDPASAAKEALNAALEDTGRDGEMPHLVWITSSPGQEEAVIAGIEDVLGPDIPIVGGSSADNDLSGQWRQFNHRNCGAMGEPGVVISVLSTSGRVGTAFFSAYSPTEKTAIVTKSKGRTILELDNRPARDVYDGWLGGSLSDLSRSETSNILFRSSLSPLGRKHGTIHGAPVFLLSHPETVTREGGISLFTNIETSDEVILMSGSEDTLVNRAGRVTESSIRLNEIDPSKVVGAVIVYCAGCMLTVQDRMDDTCKGINDVLEGKPFVGTFTFGEQGHILGGRNCHGNLMISAVVFGE